MANDDILDPEQSIQKADFSSALSERYLAYALSTITSRSLPDVRDGLNLFTDAFYLQCAS